jgi:hypothetical protein
MSYSLLASLTVCVHFVFLVFIVTGGFLARRYRWLAVPHLLAAAWGFYVEAMPGIVCPLTALENSFASRAGGTGYSNSFIEHYLLPVLYPDGLTRTMQWSLAALLVTLTIAVYSWPRRLKRA